PPPPLLVVIQARNERKAFAAFCQKGFPALDINFFESFDAVSQKPRAHDVDVADSLPGPLAQGRFGIRLQPLLSTKTTLKCNVNEMGTTAQPAGKQDGCFHAIASIGVAFFDDSTRQAVKAEQQFLRHAVLCPVSLGTGR